MLAASSTATAPREVLKTNLVPRAPPKNAIDAAILELATSRRHRDVEKLFDGRAKYGAIKGWRLGRRVAPAWARALLGSRLEAVARRLEATANKKAAALLHVAAELEKETGG